MDRIGLIIPSSNIVIEDALQRNSGFFDPAVRFHIARLPVVHVNESEGSAQQFDEPAIAAAMERLSDAGVDKVIFAGTAGAWLGLERERAWQKRASLSSGLEVTSTTLITLEALHAGEGPIGLITPFTGDIHERIKRNFESDGVPIATGRWLGLTASRDMADVTPEAISDLVLDCLDNSISRILFFCTNLRGQEACGILRTQYPQMHFYDSVEMTLEGALPD